MIPELITPSTNEPQSLEDILKKPPSYPRALVGAGLLYEQTKMIVYGRYKALKSMLGLDLAFSLAGGRDWLGFSTPDSGVSVFYLQLEISYQLFRSRLSQTWSHRQRYGNLLKPLNFWTQHWLKLDQAAGFNLLNHYMNQYRPDLLIVDPLYKVLSGNLLAAIDVQKVIDSLDILMGRYGMSIVLISHTRKGLMDMGEWGSDDLIGSMFFSAWADTILKVERRGGDRLAVKFDVVRHAETELEPKEVLFNRDTLELTVIEQLKPSTDSEKKEQ